MRGGNAANPRQQWYDRNPLAINKSYGATIAPAGTTVQWSYTVPAGRKAYIEVGQVGHMRITAAAPASTITSQMRYTPSGGSALPIMQALTLDNTVGAQAQIPLGASVLMFAGDVLEGQTSDVSTGGTVTFRIFAKLTEFDA